VFASFAKTSSVVQGDGPDAHNQNHDGVAAAAGGNEAHLMRSRRNGAAAWQTLVRQSNKMLKGIARAHTFCECVGIRFETDEGSVNGS
jgi:hypothetical protein